MSKRNISAMIDTASQQESTFDTQQDYEDAPEKPSIKSKIKNAARNAKNKVAKEPKKRIKMSEIPEGPEKEELRRQARELNRKRKIARDIRVGEMRNLLKVKHYSKEHKAKLDAKAALAKKRVKLPPLAEGEKRKKIPGSEKSLRSAGASESYIRFVARYYKVTRMAAAVPFIINRMLDKTLKKITETTCKIAKKHKLKRITRRKLPIVLSALEAALAKEDEEDDDEEEEEENIEEYEDENMDE